MTDIQREKLNPILERMFNYLEAKEIAPTKADRLMESGNGRLGKMRSNNTSPKPKFIENFLRTFNDANRNYIENGEEPMILEVRKPRLEANPLHLASDPNDLENDGSRFEEMSDGTLRMRVPVINHRAYAGYLRGFQDPEFYEELETISIDVFKQHKGHYLAFEIKGESMTTLEPEFFKQSIFEGSIAIGRELSKHLWQYRLHTHTYDSWIIVHKTEGILTKQIIDHNTETGHITIHSLNPDKSLYPDEVLFLDDIEQIFNVVQIVNRR